MLLFLEISNRGDKRTAVVKCSKLENTEQLQDAFLVFNQLSQTLTDSYRELEAQVARLTLELTAARSERLQSLIEKEQLVERLQKLIETLPGGVIVLDAAGRVIQKNAVTIELLNEPLIGELWLDIMHRCFEGHSTNPHEQQLKNGQFIGLSIRSLGDNSGHIILLTDVSEMRALQNLVDHQKRLSVMGEMMARLAHQIRTPLSTAILYSSHLGKSGLTDSQRECFSNKLLERLFHLERQVDDMLIYAREGKVAMKKMSIRRMLDELRDWMQSCLIGKDIAFEIKNRSIDLSFIGNEEALLGVLMNLLNNSIEAIGNQGSIQLIVTEQKGKFLLVSILDDGPGIKKVDCERIFEPFYTTRSNGTGLGLAVVESVVRSHGGRVWCDSSLKSGIGFHIELPLIDTDSPLPGGYSSCKQDSDYEQDIYGITTCDIKNDCSVVA